MTPHTRLSCEWTKVFPQHILNLYISCQYSNLCMFLIHTSTISGYYYLRLGGMSIIFGHLLIYIHNFGLIYIYIYITNAP